MKPILYFFTLLALFSCSKQDSSKLETELIGKLDKPVKKEISEKTRSKSIPVDRISIEEVEFSAEGLLIYDRTKIYDSNFEVMDEHDFTSGQFITINGISNEKVGRQKSTDYCQQFPFVKVSNGAATGWILGSDVYQFLKTGVNRTLLIGSNYYKVHQLKNFGIGAQDEDGFTGCDEQYTVALQVNNTSDYKLILLTTSEYATLSNSVRVTNISSDSTTAVFSIDAEYMENAETYDIYVSAFDEPVLKGEIKNRKERKFE